MLVVCTSIKRVCSTEILTKTLRLVALHTIQLLNSHECSSDLALLRRPRCDVYRQKVVPLWSFFPRGWRGKSCPLPLIGWFINELNITFSPKRKLHQRAYMFKKAILKLEIKITVCVNSLILTCASNPSLAQWAKPKQNVLLKGNVSYNVSHRSSIKTTRLSLPSSIATIASLYRLTMVKVIHTSASSVFPSPLFSLVLLGATVPALMLAQGLANHPQIPNPAVAILVRIELKFNYPFWLCRPQFIR